MASAFGQPRSKLNGRPVPFVATFVRDDDGRVVGMSGQFGPEWTDDDLTAAQAVQADDDSRCGGCGHPRDVSHSPDHQLDWSASTSRCHACAAAARAAEKFDDRAGLHVRSWIDDNGGG